MKGLKSILVLAASTFAIAGAAFAQEGGAPQPASESNAVQTFDPAFFARFSPVTAFDMVRQLPGFSIDSGESLRGFGATAGNVLIDGRRPSSKDAIAVELERIPAGDVLRIELIGAASAGDLDVRGYTELANVVLRPAAKLQESTTFAGTLRYTGERVSQQVGGTRAWKTDGLGGRLSVQLTNLGGREEIDITQRTPGGVLLATGDQFSQDQLVEVLVTGSLNWQASPRDTFNLNGKIMPRLFNVQSGLEVRAPNDAVIARASDDYEEKDIWHFELGGDYEHRFSPESAVKLISVNRLVKWRPQDLFTEQATGGPLEQTRINSALEAGEHVLRSVWTQKTDANNTLEIGAEGAFNYRDQQRDLAFSLNGGAFTPITLPLSTVKVEETRYELFINDTWRVDPTLTLEAGFTYEASTISAVAPADGVDRESDFSYPKPRAVATWTPAKDTQWRLAVEREVAQLDFSEFASDFEFINNQITVGNPDLEPEQAWKSSLQWKQQLGERGSVSLTAFYDQIDDAQDFILTRLNTPFCSTAPANDPTCVFTAAGNIGDGERYGFSVDATYPLDDFGVKGGILKFQTTLQDSEVTDPIDGELRRIADEIPWSYYFEFRQDIPEWKMAWGWDYFSAGPSKAFRLDEIQKEDIGEGDLDIFVETTALLGGLLVRLSAENIGDMPEEEERRFFSPNRLPGGAFVGTEFRTETYGPTFTLTVAGAF
jgi:outer membrane receptor protein involved in Fe transport